MDLTSGNSGNLLFETITKIGPGVAQEAAFCQFLGDDVCPKIYHIGIDMYTMEKLKPAPWTPGLLRRIEDLLYHRVWSRPALPSSMDVDWRDKLLVYGIKVPDWIKPTASCLCHGDPTASNALSGRNGLIFIADPRPPRDFIPQCRETDVGRLIQSYHGWEVVAYGAPKVDFERPKYWNNQAIFWCGAACARIEYLERSRANRQHILDWCRNVRGICGV